MSCLVSLQNTRRAHKRTVHSSHLVSPAACLKSYRCHHCHLCKVPSSVDVGRSLPSFLMLFRSQTSQRLKESRTEERHVGWIQAPARRCPVCGGQHSHARFVRSALRGYPLFACVLVLFSHVSLRSHHLFLVRVLQDLHHSIECVTHSLFWKSPHAVSYLWEACILSCRPSCAHCSGRRFSQNNHVSGVVAFHCCTCDQCVHFCSSVSPPWFSHRRC